MSHPHSPAFDFGIVICLRIHDANPWALERLERLSGYYDALPPVRVVDFGSAPPHAARLAEVCARHGFEITRVEDSGAFSLAAARNAGMRAEGPALRLLTDIDFFLRPGDFIRIQELIGALDLTRRIDVTLNLPAWHLTSAATQAFEAAPRPGAFLDRLGFDAAHRPFGEDIVFAAPYSNVFLIHRDFFELTGGYDERFRGHGSEDFEFLTRAGLVAGQITPPDKLESNGWGPLRPGFFAPKPYAGHRRFLEAISLPTELTGLRAFHLHHPTADPASADGWMSENDWKRERLAEAFAVYLEDRVGLIAADHLPRPRRALCVCLSPLHRDVFLPFRLLGYRLDAIRGPEDAAGGAAALAAGTHDLLMIFNPDAEAQAPFRPLIAAARAAGVDVVVAQHGPAPGTLIYAADMADRCPGFDAAAVAAATFSAEELDDARAFLAGLPAPRPRVPGPLRVLVPLQPPADLSGAPRDADDAGYPAFVAGLDAAAAAHPEIELLVLPDPRARATPGFSAPNIRMLPAADVLPAGSDPAGFDVVICHSARAGLAAALGGAPVICTGRAMAARLGLAVSAPDAASALAMAAGAAPAPGELTLRSAAWLTHRALSACVSPSGPRRPGLPEGPRYDGFAVSRLRWNGTGLRLGRMAETGRSSPESYAGGRLGMISAPSPRRERTEQMQTGGHDATASIERPRAAPAWARALLTRLTRGRGAA